MRLSSLPLSPPLLWPSPPRLPSPPSVSTTWTTPRATSAPSLTRVYNTCYTVSQFYLPRFASFINNDPHKSKLSVTLYETGNSGGRWTRASGPMKNGLWHSWGKRGTVHPRAGSVLVHGAETSNGDGKIVQYKPAVIADWHHS
ncbi:hypothetical protein DFQ27_001644, partial [Actinomortierella ambigua]